MGIFERINRSFGSWYEGLFGGGDDVRPRDILRQILLALEDGRKEGVDGRTYVPNQYILEISVEDQDEKEYLLSFLDKAELETAIRRHCQQNRYHVRGALDFTIKEVEPDEAVRRQKVRVRCRYDARLAAARPEPPHDAPPPQAPHGDEPDEDHTVPDARHIDDEEDGTVPAVSTACVTVSTPGKVERQVPLGRRSLTVGRSTLAGNDIVLDGDGMVSRRHARIEVGPDGSFVVYDLDTTNGTRVNGKAVENRVLRDGDEIAIGASRLVFHAPDAHAGMGQAGSAGWAPAARPAVPRARPARLVLTDGANDVDEFILAEETLIGRGVTNDVVLPDRTVAIRHARLQRGASSSLEALAADQPTTVDGVLLAPGSPATLHSGAIITFGNVSLRFEDELR